MTTAAVEDMATPPMSTPDMARKAPMPDMAKQTVVDMMTPLGPDMAKPVYTCSHSPCVSGKALNASCSSCVNMFCNDSNNGDPLCCSSSYKWDSICVGEYKAYPCGAVCP
jgi:hypothetical protein